MPRIKLPLTGSKVLIRKLYKKDLNELYTLDIDKDVKKYVGGPITRSREEWVAGMRQLVGSRQATLPFPVIYKETGAFAGRATIFLKDFDECCWEIQILIAKKHWGKRLGREVCELLMTAAYGDLGAKSLIAIVAPENTASRNLVEAFGFVNVGTNRYEKWDNGHYIFKHQPSVTP